MGSTPISGQRRGQNGNDTAVFGSHRSDTSFHAQPTPMLKSIPLRAKSTTTKVCWLCGFNGANRCSLPGSLYSSMPKRCVDDRRALRQRRAGRQPESGRAGVLFGVHAHLHAGLAFAGGRRVPGCTGWRGRDTQARHQGQARALSTRRADATHPGARGANPQFSVAPVRPA